jgi:hypothetical protein
MPWHFGAAGAERQFSLDGARGRIRFSRDATQVAVASSESLSLWDVAAGRSVWLIPLATRDRPAEVRWSVDGQSLIVRYGSLGTELFDARTGERLARFPAARTSVSLLRTDLRAKLVIGSSNWELRPVPEPVNDPPGESLARVLRRTGLTLEGVEVVAAP